MAGGGIEACLFMGHVADQNSAADYQLLDVEYVASFARFVDVRSTHC